MSKQNKPLVCVKWLDSQANKNGWFLEKDMSKKYVLPLVYTVGYIVHETKEYVFVAHSLIFYKKLSNQINGTMAIPRGRIKMIYNLKKDEAYVKR